MNFQGRKAAASMASKSQTDARFELSGPDYPQVLILSKEDICPVRPAGSAAGKKGGIAP